MGASVESLAQAMALDPDVLMYGDNKAAISLAVLQTGSWRTRHLRVRASKLREVLKKGMEKEEPANQAYGWYSVGCRWFDKSPAEASL